VIWIDDDEWEVMERIVALLVMLAGVADRAARLPLVLRLPVLLVLAAAERMTRTRLVGLLWDVPALADRALPAEGDWADRIGDRLRALAAALCALMAQCNARLRVLIHAIRLRALRSIAPDRPAGSTRPRLAPVAPDTS
jgi:hypothetical protein